jgi:hypothetical protein
MRAHDAAVKAAAAGGPPVPGKLATQMDGALLAIGSLSSTLKSRVSLRRACRPCAADSFVRLLVT